MLTDDASSYGVEISSTGMSGDFVAFGVVKNTNQTEAVDFTDPAPLHSPGTVYSGVSAGHAALIPDTTYVPPW